MAEITKDEEKSKTYTVQARLISENNEQAGDILSLPINISTQELQMITQQFLGIDDDTPMLFYVEEDEIHETLEQTLDKRKTDYESIINIIYSPQQNFKVRPVTRCSSEMPGHQEAVIAVSFSPDGRALASGAGDNKMRLWDLNTETPMYECTGHIAWVLVVEWAPDGLKLASADKAGRILLWNPENGQQMGKPLLGHKKWILALSWEPYHSNPDCRRLASAGKDNDARIWDVVMGTCLMTLAGHTAPVTCVRWGGSGLLYTSSQDRTVKMWRASDGVMCRTFSGHAHWVNSLALNTAFVLRTGPFHPVKDQKQKTQIKDSKQFFCIF